MLSEPEDRPAAANGIRHDLNHGHASSGTAPFMNSGGAPPLMDSGGTPPLTCGSQWAGITGVRVLSVTPVRVSAWFRVAAPPGGSSAPASPYKIVPGWVAGDDP
ncbi:hypothetical protein Ssi02_12860 [Sinosporangium siamense]|uniref:Uncharacterized protein n=1 Tax=Sinosporangium siamense TaxID=1367973 RepID=A0A919RE11_9ACTN|nr:hypothetical protein Ssi02_12860 [Sinosporangium siamense]